MSTSKTSTSSAALAASERSGEAGNAAGAPPSTALQLPDSEVTARPHRRRFSAEYKLSIIEQADLAQGAGGVGKNSKPGPSKFPWTLPPPPPTCSSSNPSP